MSSTTAGSSRALTDFVEAASAGKYDVVFMHGSNPVHTAPDSVGLKDALGKVPFKVAFSMFTDETTMSADLVLPLNSPYEEWGTHVGSYQPTEAVVSISQPMMKPLYPETKAFGDILLSMLKHHKVGDFGQFDDYYAYLRSAFAALPTGVKGGKSDNAFWASSVEQGFFTATAKGGSLSAKLGDVSQTTNGASGDFPMTLVPSSRQTMWDGRGANLPWLLEQPDQITKVFWESVAEIHPKTAMSLGVKEGDFIRVESENGAFELQVYIHKGIHTDVVAVPMGLGHEEYGRYAKGTGVNPLKILSAKKDAKTGELATYATHVRVTKTGRSAEMPRLGGSETQVGRKLVSTVSADSFRKTEGGSNVA